MFSGDSCIFNGFVFLCVRMLYGPHWKVWYNHTLLPVLEYKVLVESGGVRKSFHCMFSFCMSSFPEIIKISAILNTDI